MIPFLPAPDFFPLSLSLFLSLSLSLLSDPTTAVHPEGRPNAALATAPAAAVYAMSRIFLLSDPKTPRRGPEVASGTTE